MEVLDEHQDAGSGVGSADADVVEAAVAAEGELAVGVDAVAADPVARAGGPSAGGGFAVGMIDADSTECVMIGDSTSDVFAGLLAGVPVIGYASKPGKAQALADVQAVAVITDLNEITSAMKAD